MDQGDGSGGFTAYAGAARAWLRCEAYRLCRDWYEADDLVQATLLKVFRAWHRLSDREQLAGYARQVLLHAYLSEHRRPRWRSEVSRAELPERGLVVHSLDDGLALVAAVERLSPRQREVIRLRFWADLSLQQTAEVLGCSPGTVASQSHHAIRKLRTMLDPVSF